MEQVQRLQSIEREMLSEGRSSSDIDAFKARLRQQSFTGENPQFSGVGALNETARDMNRGPRGLAVYMDKGGDPSVVRLGGRRTKNAPRPVNAPTRDGNQSMALTNEDIETLVDFTPFFGDIKGGADGAEFIKEELKRDEPNYLLMGIVGGAAVVGVVPVLGDVAQKLIMRGARNFKKDRVTEETLSMLSEEDARIVQDLTNKTPETDLTQNEILADSIASDLRANKISRVTDERLEDLDFKGEIRLRQHYIDGNVGVDADGVPITLENSQQRMIDQGYDPSLVRYHGGNENIKTLSADMGEFRRTETGFFSSENPNVADSYVSRLSGLSGRSGGQIYPVVGRNNTQGLSVDLEGGNYNEISKKTPVINSETNTSGQTAYDFFPEVFDNDLHPDGRVVRDTNDLARAARKSGYSHVNFLNTVDRGPNYKRYFPGESSQEQNIRELSASSPSNVRVDFEGSNVRVPTAIFDPRLTKLKNIGMADGGAVMQGVGSLNETARGMSRGPRGLAVYMQEGGDPAEESFFERFNPLTGSYRRKKPLSVKAAETAIDFSPVGTVKAIDEIYDEYQQEEPDLAKMGIMAAAEVAGYLPLAGPAVKTMVRGPLFPKGTPDFAAELLTENLQKKIPRQKIDNIILKGKTSNLSTEEINKQVLDEARQLKVPFPKRAFDNPKVEYVDTQTISDNIAQYNFPRYDVGKFGGDFESGNLNENPFILKDFEESGKETLKENIFNEGIRDPIHVEVVLSDGSINISEGHHRLQAAIELGIEEVPIIVKTMNKPRASPGMSTDMVGPAKIDVSGLKEYSDYSFSDLDFENRVISPKETPEAIKNRGGSYFFDPSDAEVPLSDRKLSKFYTPMREGYYRKTDGFADGGAVMQGVGAYQQFSATNR